MKTNSSNSINLTNDTKIKKENIDFPYPLAIDKDDDMEKIDYNYNYNEADFERIDEEFINEITHFQFENNKF